MGFSEAHTHMRPGITSLLSVLMSSSCPPSQTISSTLIVVRVSHSHNKCTPCHLTSSLLPCLLAFKNRRSFKMILQIVAPLVASVGAAAALKQDLCVSPMASSFSVVDPGTPTGPAVGPPSPIACYYLFFGRVWC